MSNTSLSAELKRQIAEHDARIAQDLGADRVALHAARQALQGLPALGSMAPD